MTVESVSRLWVQQKVLRPESALVEGELKFTLKMRSAFENIPKVESRDDAQPKDYLETELAAD